MTRSEAGKLGFIASQQKLTEAHEKRKQQYLDNPSWCQNCNTPLPFNKKRQLFCSHVCAAQHNNKKQTSECQFCGKIMTTWTDNSRKRVFCSRKCLIDSADKVFIQSWKDGTETGWRGSSATLCRPVRRYIFEKSNGACIKCGWSETNPFTNKIPLQIHHKDGNAKNATEENLELLCPSCHSLTDNFGARNKGNSTRPKRYTLKETTPP